MTSATTWANHALVHFIYPTLFDSKCKCNTNIKGQQIRPRPGDIKFNVATVTPDRAFFEVVGLAAKQIAHPEIQKYFRLFAALAAILALLLYPNHQAAAGTVTEDHILQVGRRRDNFVFNSFVFDFGLGDQIIEAHQAIEIRTDGTLVALHTHERVQ